MRAIYIYEKCTKVIIDYLYWKVLIKLSLVIYDTLHSNQYLSGNLIAEFHSQCCEFKPLELGKRTNSCIRVNTRELDKEPFT